MQSKKLANVVDALIDAFSKLASIMLLYRCKEVIDMMLEKLRLVLESEALSRSELVGFLVALFVDEDAGIIKTAEAAEARALLARLKPHDRQTQLLWMSAVHLYSEICKPQN